MSTSLPRLEWQCVAHSPTLVRVEYSSLSALPLKDMFEHQLQWQPQFTRLLTEVQAPGALAVEDQQVSDVEMVDFNDVFLNCEESQTGKKDQETAQTFSPKTARQVESFAARYCGVLAMGHLGFPALRIERHARGRWPVWPRPFVGALTHCKGQAAAALVGYRQLFFGLGIDIEKTIGWSPGGKQKPRTYDLARLRQRICAPEEWSHLQQQLTPIWRAQAGCLGFEDSSDSRFNQDLFEAMLTTLIFSAKESLYKCLHPIVQHTIPWGAVRIGLTEEAETGAYGAILLHKGLFTVEILSPELQQVLAEACAEVEQAENSPLNEAWCAREMRLRLKLKGSWEWNSDLSQLTTTCQLARPARGSFRQDY